MKITPSPSGCHCSEHQQELYFIARLLAAPIMIFYNDHQRKE